jgi:hypothetical protein
MEAVNFLELTPDKLASYEVFREAVKTINQQIGILQTLPAWKTLQDEWDFELVRAMNIGAITYCSYLVVFSKRMNRLLEFSNSLEEIIEFQITYEKIIC